MKYEPVIGLECHVQLLTRTKAFSAASAAYGGAPNHYTDPYTLALPGTLPYLSRAAVDYALAIGLATGCQIRRYSRFARKHYFYPDLPKGFQISQYDEPLCEHGQVEFVVAGEVRRVRLTRIHMEEDAGKSLHVPGANYSLVDFNRAGVPLVEMVSEPDLGSAAEAGAYLRAVRQLVRYLGISDGNMEEGSLRCDANVSVRLAGETRLGTKAELKNINSFKHVEAAIEFEIARQAELLERGERVVQETRLWDAERGVTKGMRSKEEAHDYRYFPEPDLPPLVIPESWIEEVKARLPELPLARRQRFTDELGLSAYDAEVLTAEKEVADYFEDLVKTNAKPKMAANWITSELFGRLNRAGKTIEESPVDAQRLGELIMMIDTGMISGKIAKDVFERMWTTGQSASQIVGETAQYQITDQRVLESECRKVIDDNPKQVAAYQAGKTQLFGFFVGQVMKATQGRASPELVNEILRRLLEKRS